MCTFIMAIGEIMGILNRPIEMIAFHTAAGKVTPMRFRIMDGDDVSVVKVDRIINRTKEKSLGKDLVRFTCASVINGIEKRYELVFHQDTVRWVLYKM